MLDGDELGAFDVNATDDQVGTDMATVFESMFGKAVTRSLDSTLGVGVEAVEFELSRNHFCHVVTVGSCSCTAYSDVGSEVVDLIAIFGGNNCASSGSCISCDCNTALYHFWLKDEKCIF